MNPAKGRIFIAKSDNLISGSRKEQYAMIDAPIKFMAYQIRFSIWFSNQIIFLLVDNRQISWQRYCSGAPAARRHRYFL